MTMTTNTSNFRFALRQSLPILCGYLALGFGYGLYMHNLGLAFWYPTLMAATIYGGSVEFVLANMLVQKFNPVMVLVITLVVGFRQFFYSVSMLSRYRHAGWRKWLLIFGLSDETFVLNYYTKVPTGLDRTSVNFWITVLDWAYWVSGALWLSRWRFSNSNQGPQFYHDCPLHYFGAGPVSARGVTHQFS